MAAEQKGNFTTNNNVSYVGGVTQFKTSNVSTSQPAEYEAFRAKKASELSNFLHNPYVDFKYVNSGNYFNLIERNKFRNAIYAGCTNASRLYETHSDNTTMANGIGK